MSAAKFKINPSPRQHKFLSESKYKLQGDSRKLFAFEMRLWNQTRLYGSMVIEESVRASSLALIAPSAVMWKRCWATTSQLNFLGSKDLLFSKAKSNPFNHLLITKSSYLRERKSKPVIKLRCSQMKCLNGTQVISRI